MKKVFAIFLCMAMMLTMVSCGTPSPSASAGADGKKPVTLVFKSLAWIKAEQEAQNKLIAQWNAEHPDIQVQLVGSDWGNASQELLTSFETGDVPDIFHYAQPIIADWKNLGFLEDLTPMLSEEDLADVNEDVWSGLKSDDPRWRSCGCPFRIHHRPSHPV